MGGRTAKGAHFVEWRITQSDFIPGLNRNTWKRPPSSTGLGLLLFSAPTHSYLKQSSYSTVCRRRKMSRRSSNDGAEQHAYKHRQEHSLADIGCYRSYHYRFRGSSSLYRDSVFVIRPLAFTSTLGYLLDIFHIYSVHCRMGSRRALFVAYCYGLPVAACFIKTQSREDTKRRYWLGCTLHIDVYLDLYCASFQYSLSYFEARLSSAIHADEVGGRKDRLANSLLPRS